ncbi:hypothetical protein Tco_1382425, partial [Tanacetum coccineum]
AKVVEIVAFIVVGVGISIDSCGRRMNGRICGGIIVVGAVEDSGIT